MARSPLVVTREGVYELHVRGGAADRRLDLWGLDAQGQPIFLGRYPGSRVPRGPQYLGAFHLGQRIYLWHDLDSRGEGGRASTHAYDVVDETAYRVTDSGNGEYDVTILDPQASGRVLLSLAVSPRREIVVPAATGPQHARSGPSAAVDAPAELRVPRVGSAEVAALAASSPPVAPATVVASAVPALARAAAGNLPAASTGDGAGRNWLGGWILPGLVGLCFAGATTMNRKLRRRPEDLTPAQLMGDADRYFRRGRAEKALKYLALLIEGGAPGPERELGRLRRGLHWLSSGDQIHAREDLLKVDAEALSTDDLYTLGVALEQVEEEVSAMAVFERLAARSPGHADVDIRLRRLGAAAGAAARQTRSVSGTVLAQAQPAAAASDPAAAAVSAGEVQPTGTLGAPVAAAASVDAAVAQSVAGDTGRGTHERVSHSPMTSPAPAPESVPPVSRSAFQGSTNGRTPSQAGPLTHAGTASPGGGDPALDAVISRAREVLAEIALVTSTPLGFLFSARDRQSGEIVTLKVLAPSLAQHADLRRQFLAEAASLMRVAHPGVVRVLRVMPDLPGFTHEPLEGATLEATLAKVGRMSIRDVIAIGLRLAEGLGALHACGIVHRDVRPGTIFLEGSRPRLLDLGLASAPISRLLGMTGRTSGRAPYIAPEESQAGEGARPVDARADIYALGVTLYEILTGQHPSGPQPPAASTLVPGIPPALDLALDRCLRLEPEERFLDAGQLREALVGLHEEWSSPATLRTRLLVLLEKLVTGQLRPLALLLAPSGGGDAGPTGVSALFWHPTVKDDVRALVSGPQALRVRVAQALELARALEAWADKGPLATVLTRLESVARGADGLDLLLAPETRSGVSMDRSMAEAVGRLSNEIEPAIEAIEATLAAHEIDVRDVVQRVTGRYSSLLRTDMDISARLCGRFADVSKAAPAMEQAIDRLAEAAIERGAHVLAVRGDFLPGRARLRLELRDDGRPLPPRQFGDGEQPHYKLLELARSLVKGLGGHSELAGVGQSGLTVRLVIPTHLV